METEAVKLVEKDEKKIQTARDMELHEAAAQAARAPDPTALLHHLAERYSAPDAPATFLIEGALDTEITVTFTHGPDGKKLSVTGKTVDEAAQALRLKLSQPEEEPVAKPKARPKAAPVITRSNTGA